MLQQIAWQQQYAMPIQLNFHRNYKKQGMISKMTVEELEKKLKTDKLSSLYLLYGEETFLLEQQLKKIKKLFGETVKGINYIIIDENNIQELISDIETPAFGYEKKLIVARNTGIFKRETKNSGVSKELKDKIKTDYCQTHGIKLLRIPYTQYNEIENIITSIIC